MIKTKSNRRTFIGALAAAAVSTLGWGGGGQRSVERSDPDRPHLLKTGARCCHWSVSAARKRTCRRTGWQKSSRTADRTDLARRAEPPGVAAEYAALGG